MKHFNLKEVYAYPPPILRQLRNQVVIDEKDMTLKCPECGQQHYSRIAPAIIVAIRKWDEMACEI